MFERIINFGGRVVAAIETQFDMVAEETKLSIKDAQEFQQRYHPGREPLSEELLITRAERIRRARAAIAGTRIDPVTDLRKRF